MAGKHIGHGYGGGWAKEGSSERNPNNDQYDVNYRHKRTIAVSVVGCGVLLGKTLSPGGVPENPRRHLDWRCEVIKLVLRRARNPKS